MLAEVTVFVMVDKKVDWTADLWELSMVEMKEKMLVLLLVA